MRGKKIAATGTIGLVLGAGALIAGPTAASATVVTRARPAGCETATDDAWPAWTNGRPANGRKAARATAS